MSVAVLIGSYDNADTLGRAIESMLGQTLPPAELLVVDDGSTDDTAGVAAGYASSGVRRLALPHMGISRSLNAGLAAVSAPYVAIQDADDWSLPTRLERQVALLEARPDVAVVGCRMREVGPDGAVLRPRTSFAPGDVRRALWRFNPIPNGSACLRRSAVLAAGGYDPRYRWAMEYDLWLRLAEHHTIWTLDEELAVRTMSASNVASTREREQLAEVVRMVARAAWRRRALAGVVGAAVPAISWATPLGVKRALRSRLGQAP